MLRDYVRGLKGNCYGTKTPCDSNRLYVKGMVNFCSHEISVFVTLLRNNVFEDFHYFSTKYGPALRNIICFVGCNVDGYVENHYNCKMLTMFSFCCQFDLFSLF